MSYAIVVFRADRACSAYSFYNLVNRYGEGMLAYWPASRLAEMKAKADDAAYGNSAHYAVYDVGLSRPSFNNASFTAMFGDDVSAMPVPVYVAEASRSDLAYNHRWHIASNGAAMATVGRELGTVAGDVVGSRGFLAALGASPIPAPTPAYRYPIDTALPIELSDGTPCEVISVTESGRSMVVRVLARPTGHYPIWSEGDCWAHMIADGSWLGSATYLRVRNRSAYAASAPVAAPVAAPAPTFEVRSGLNGTERDTWSCVVSFDNGKDAAAWVGANKAAYTDNGKALAIVKVEGAAVSVDWMAREAERMRDGEYTAVPEPWASMVATAYPEQFLHLSAGDKLKLAFTESAAAGAKDRQKVLSAAEYAARYFGNNSDYGHGWWSSEQRASFIGSILGDAVKPLMSPLGDVEALVSVYRQCDRGDHVTSCMTHGLNSYATSIHPVSVYAMKGELTLAFLRGDDRGAVDVGAAWDDDNDDSPIVARSLVWIKDGENREYGRVYGDTQSARMLRLCLEAQGFRQGELLGAKFGRVEYGGGGFVMPYLDVGNQTFDDMGDHCVLGGDLDGQMTDGTACGVELTSCDCCGDRYDGESEGGEVITGNNGRWGNETEYWCEGCLESNTFNCEHLEATVSDSHQGEYIASNGFRVTVADWLLDNGSIDDVMLCEDGEYREDAGVCEDCSYVLPGADLKQWDGRDTGESFQSEGDTVCDDCHGEREAAALKVALDNPELPLELNGRALVLLAA
jgi:hypothetical protein